MKNLKITIKTMERAGSARVSLRPPCEISNEAPVVASYTQNSEFLRSKRGGVFSKGDLKKI